MSEIKKVARHDPVLAAEGAIRFLERVSPALEHVDSSSGAIGTAVNHAIEELVVELLALLEKDPFPWWTYRQWGVRALAALGRMDDAMRYAEASRGRNDSPVAIARVCEEILLGAGRLDDAYRRCALEASRGTSYLATYRALAGKYPGKRPGEIARGSRGDHARRRGQVVRHREGDRAVRRGHPARQPDAVRSEDAGARRARLRRQRPEFALEAGLAALRWLVDGHGYEITGADVWAAYASTMKAAAAAGRAGEVRQHIRRLVAGETFGDRFVTRILGRDLGL